MTTNTQDLPRWDLTNVYPSMDSDEFKAAVKQLDQMADDLEAFTQKHNISPQDADPNMEPAKLAEIIGEFIDKVNQTYRLLATLRAYLMSFITTDSRNDQAKKLYSQVEQTIVRVQQQEDVLFKGWLGALAEKVPQAIELNPTAKVHAFSLGETIEQSKYMMSSDEEGLAAELGLSGANAWQRLQGTITSQLKWQVEGLDGHVQELPMTAILNFRSHPDETMRRRGYEAEMEAWKSVENQVAACMNGVKGAVGVLDRRRGRQDSLHSAIDQSRIDRQTLEAMLEAMVNSFPMFRKYYRSKAKKLGKENLPWWDIFAPMGKTDTTYTYPEAQQIVLDNFAKFSPDLVDFAKKAFDNNWIDVGPRDGKRAGAFCMGVPGVNESRILTNFDGSLDGVFTLAHELGHGYHTEQMLERTIIQRSTPMTLAETASIMCETVITNAAIENAAGPEEELAILETALTGDSQVVVDIYSRYLFEKEVFERRAKAELSAQDFNEIMLASQKEAFGDALDEDYLHPYMWVWKPHYYRPGLSFYNYPYAFGLLFGTGLYAIYKDRGDEFIPQYRELLSSTGMGTAAELAAGFDIDLRSPDFWQASFDLIGLRVDRYLAL